MYIYIYIYTYTRVTYIICTPYLMDIQYLIYTCAVTHRQMCRLSFTGVPQLIHTCAGMYPHV